MEHIEKGRKVVMDYTVTTTTRNGVTNTLPGQSCSFVFGVNRQYPSVEEALRGRAQGDRVRVIVPAEEVYGLHDETLVREIPREDFKENRLKEGQVYREMKQGCLVRFVVRELRDETVLADFNDPNAGVTADFDIVVKWVGEPEASAIPLSPSCGSC